MKNRYLSSKPHKRLFALFRAFIISRHLLKNLNKLPSSCSLQCFEVGPGRAELAFSVCLSSQVSSYEVIDTSREVLSFIKRSLFQRIPIIRTKIKFPAVSFYESSFKLISNKQFDLIISSHVAEHVASVSEHIGLLTSLLAPNGLLYVASPNLGSIPNQKKGANWIGYKDSSHISLHSVDEMQNLLESFGLKIVSIGSSPVTLHDAFSAFPTSLFWQKSLSGSSYHILARQC